MADVVATDRIVEALARGLGGAVEAAGGQPLEVEAGAGAPGPGWATPLVAAGLAEGPLTAWVDQAGVGAIGRTMLGIDEDPEPTVIGDMLRSLWTQAALAATASDALSGLTLTPGQPLVGDVPAGAGWVVRRGSAILATIVVTGTLRPAVASSFAAPRQDVPVLAAGALPGNLAALLDIDLPLVARFARTEMSLRALTQLGPGSLVDMGRSPDAPVHLLVGSQVVAEGEVVVVGGNYGVRITHLVSPAERLRAMEL
jgi:flagellar motor switch protein FliN/FliY